jgi:NADH:ubiquinone oxidoreductase subunit F (NADH-binding)
VSLIGEVERSGLRGRGGAAFPTAVKLASVARRRQPLVVANANEGEPLSAKDKTLLVNAPHLVLDGAALVAETVGATQVIVCLEHSAAAPAASLQAALAERRGADDLDIQVLGMPSRFVAGEETAVIHWLNGGDAKPTLVPPRPFERGVRGRPTLVQNVETLAHLALIARFGGEWFRRIGTAGDPGTRLLTVSGGVAEPGVFEVASGFSLREVLAAAGLESGPPPPVLVGGYFGIWLDPDQVVAAQLDVDSMRAVGGSPGCGVVWALPAGVCGLAESARVARWYAEQSAGQCGPCVNGLPAIAGALAALVAGSRPGEAATALRRWLQTVTGRGACRLPDGAARFVASSLRVFADEVDVHARGGPCAASRRPGALPTPMGGGWR